MPSTYKHHFNLQYNLTCNKHTHGHQCSDYKVKVVKTLRSWPASTKIINKY